MPRRNDTEAILGSIDNSRREIGELFGGGLAELRHDNAELRRQLLDAITDGFGALRAENLELRARLDRTATDLADTRLQIETMRAETAEARNPQPAGVSEPADPSDYHDLLQAAAGTAYAELVCHRDTWDWLVSRAAQAEHFRLPGDVGEENDGRISVDMSGRTLIAVVDALWHTQHAADTPAGTRALAAQVYTRIADALKTVQPAIGQPETPDGPEQAVEQAPKPVVRIVIDDRP